MRFKSSVEKNSFSIRIPTDLNIKLRERAEKMGISKSALILSLLYKELGNDKQVKRNDRN